jgi:predicted dehydrogenase
MQIVRWGIIGCGDVTEVKSGPGFQKASNSSLVAVMRRSGALAREYAHRHGVPRWYDDAEALIHDPDVDAIYIATPPSSHKEYTLMSAQAGKPVYVEKPMALNFAECQAMIQACRVADVPLFVAYYRRALPRFLKIKQLVETQAIGQVRSVSIALYRPSDRAAANPHETPWRVRPEIAGGGYFVDLASHMLDFLDYLFGPVRSVQGFASNQAQHYAAEDIVTGTFVFDSGVHGVGTWCFSGFQPIDQIEITGSEGKLAFATFDASPLVLTTGAGVTEFPIEYPAHIQQPLIQQVVDALNGSGACVSTGETAARTTRVMEQMLQSYYA